MAVKPKPKAKTQPQARMNVGTAFTYLAGKMDRIEDKIDDRFNNIEEKLDAIILRQHSQGTQLGIIFGTAGTVFAIATLVVGIWAVIT